MKLRVAVNQNLETGGFNTYVMDGDNVIEERSFVYEYPSSGKERAKTVSEIKDILQDMIDEHGVDELSVVPGWNKAEDRPVFDRDVEEFKEIYCEGLKLMELSKEEKAFKESNYEAQPTIADGLRDDMIRFRRSEVENLPDKVFLDKVNGYFERNATMGGEKVLKDLAASYAKRMEADDEVYRDDSNPFGLDHAEFMDKFRDDMKDMFAKVSIKQAKVVDTDPISAVYGSTFKHDIAGDGRTHAATITVKDGGMFVPGTGAPFGDIADGFMTNHPNMDGMEAEFVMIDNSNGNYKNMTCRMLIDLSQENGDGMSLEQDDFAAAIDSLGGSGGAALSM